MQIEARKVAGVVVEADHALKDKGFNPGEVIIGLAELAGRVIVDTASTAIQADELKQVVVDHIERTVRIGAQAQGKSNIARV